MRKLLTIRLLLAISLAAVAQTIQKGNKFFNGKVLYTVQEIRMGTIVYMTGADREGNYLEMTLEKVPGKAGAYTLQPSAQADDSPFPAATFGANVQYIRQQGMNFLAVEGIFGGLADILYLTPDNLKNSLGQQEFAESQPLTELAGGMLLNSALLEGQETETLAELANNQLNRKAPSVIEKYNLQLVRGVIAYREAEEAFNNPDGLGGDGRGEDEIADEEAIKAWVNRLFEDIARRNAGGEGNPTPEDIENEYTTTRWRETMSKVFKKDEASEGIGFFDHDYWTFSQDPSPDLKVKKIEIEDYDDDGAAVFVRFVNWPGGKPQTMWLELVRENGKYLVTNIRDYDNIFDDGYFDYMKEMERYLTE